MRKKVVIIALIISLVLAAVIITVVLVKRAKEKKAIAAAVAAEWGKSAPTYCPINYGETVQSKYISLADFNSKDGVSVPKLLRGNAQGLCEDLDIIIANLPKGASIVVSSAYRSPLHNIAIGGETYSRHPCAQAVDLHPKGITPSQLKALIKSLISRGLIKNGGIGLYNTFVHYDHHSYREWYG